jgi:NAD(P)H dehydrogenase (quinone)
VIDDCDLYAEAFDPALSHQERIDYHDSASNHAAVAGYVERLLAAEATRARFLSKVERAMARF